MTVWGACGRWFESSHPDKEKYLIYNHLGVDWIFLFFCCICDLMGGLNRVN